MSCIAKTSKSQRASDKNPQPQAWEALLWVVGEGCPGDSQNMTGRRASYTEQEYTLACNDLKRQNGSVSSRTSTKPDVVAHAFNFIS